MVKALASTEALPEVLPLLPGPAAILRRDGRILHASPAFAQLFRGDQAHLAGESLTRLAGASDAERWIAALAHTPAAEASEAIVHVTAGAGDVISTYVFRHQLLPDGNLLALGSDVSWWDADREALRSLERHYRALLDRSPAIVVRHDLSGRILAANRAARQSLGIRDHDNGRLLDAARGADAEQVLAHLARLRDNGRSQGMLRLTARDGSPRVWAYTATLEDDNAPMVQLHAVDITDLAAVEDALRQSEDRYRRSLERASDSVWIFDVAGHCLYANAAAAAALRRSPGAIVGEPFCSFVEDADQDALADALRIAASGEAHASHLLHLKQADAPGIPMEFSVVDLGDGTLQAIGREMTAWLQAQERLRSSEERYRSVVNSPGRGFAVVDDDGTVRFHNDAFRKLGADADPVGPRNILTWLQPLEWGPLERAIATLREPGRTHELDLDVEHPSRGRRLLHLRLSRLSTDEVIVEVLDVTQQRALEQRALQAQRMDSVGNLAAGISHDFNNLLTVIEANLSEALAREGGDREAMIHTAIDASRSAADLAKRLMAIGRGSSVVRTGVALGPLVDALFALLRRTIDPNIRLVAEVPGGLAVLGARTEIQHALMNLALNACEAMPGGGTLTIRACAGREPPEGVASSGAGHIRIEVADTGMGMDATTIQRAFEPYFTTKAEHGHGLGLAIVYGIVRDHGGTIAINSTPGHGTRFVIDLPAAEVAGLPLADLGPGSPTDATAPDQRVILVVDDRAELRRACTAILSRAGYQVWEAERGDAAVLLVAGASRRPDLVLLDASMPGMSGPEAYTALRRMVPDLPCILMSGYAEERIDEMDRDARWTFLQKPFDGETLLRAVRGMLAPAGQGHRSAGGSGG